MPASIMTFDLQTGKPTSVTIMADPVKDAEDYKALWLAEVYRGEHGFEEVYTVSELDRAREIMAGWKKTTDKAGNIVMEYQS
jgi:hypothetical protein